MLVIPLSLKNTIEDEIALTVVYHAMECTIGYNHHATVSNAKRLCLLVAHDHLAMPLHEEVYFLLPGMSMSSGLPTSFETGRTQYQILQ